MPALRDHTTIESRIYTRRRGAGLPRFYADFRDYEDVGGAQEALSLPGCRYAVTDPEQAAKLAQARLDQLEEKRASLPVGKEAQRTLSVIIPDHLKRKAKLREATKQWLGNVQVHLETFEDYFDPNRDLADIEKRELEDYRAHLFTLSNGRGGTLSSQSVAHYLNSVSNLYDRAIGDQLLPVGGNLVAFLPPLSIEHEETPYLEVPEMAEILRFAFEEYEPERPELALPFFPVILAVLALAGLREKEALGLLRSDVDLVRRVIHVRPNAFRPRLKSKSARRPVPIFSQLWDILVAYVQGPHAPQGELFFPSYFGDGSEAMIQDLRKAYDKMPMPDHIRRLRTPAEYRAAEEARINKLERALGMRRGPKPEEAIDELRQPISETETIVHPLRAKILRHTWTTARLQNTDRGRPISLWTVAQELGHSNLDMVQEVYGHLGRFRERGEEVEFPY